MEFVSWYLSFHTYTMYCTIGTTYSNEVKRNTFPFKTRLLHLIILSFLHLNSVPDIWFSFPVKNMNNFHALVFPFSVFCFCFFFLNIFQLPKKYNTWNIKININYGRIYCLKSSLKWLNTLQHIHNTVWYIWGGFLYSCCWLSLPDIFDLHLLKHAHTRAISPAEKQSCSHLKAKTIFNA